MPEQQQYRTVDKFDRAMGTLTSLPDVTHTKPSTVVATTPMIGATQTFVLQTYRQTERDGETSKSKDTLFLQAMDDEGRIRMVIPDAVIKAVVRQQEALTTKSRKKAGREQAAARAARGEVPGFMRGKKKPKGE